MTPKKTHGFSLLQALLYVFSAGILITGISLISPQFFESRITDALHSNLENQALHIHHTLTRHIRHAQKIDFPSPNTESQILSWHTKNTYLEIIQKNDTLILKSNDKEIPLHSQDLKASNLRIKNINNLIQIHYTLTHPHTQSFRDYAQDYSFSVAPRTQ